MEEKAPSSSNQLYYVLGAVAITAIAGAVFFLKQQAPAADVSTEPSAAGTVATIVPSGPIMKLGCSQQYYNPVIGFPKYYLSTEGVDVNGPTKVDCDYKVSVAGKVVAEETATGQMQEDAARGGQKFRCTTSALELAKNVATKVEVALRDDQGGTATCSKSFLLP